MAPLKIFYNSLLILEHFNTANLPHQTETENAAWNVKLIKVIVAAHCSLVYNRVSLCHDTSFFLQP